MSLWMLPIMRNRLRQYSVLDEKRHVRVAIVYGEMWTEVTRFPVYLTKCPMTSSMKNTIREKETLKPKKAKTLVRSTSLRGFWVAVCFFLFWKHDPFMLGLFFNQNWGNPVSHRCIILSRIIHFIHSRVCFDLQEIVRFYSRLKASVYGLFLERA